MMKENITEVKGLTMYALGDERQIDQEVCRKLSFTTVTTHGAIKSAIPVPDSFRVQLVLASLERLVDAWHALQGGIKVTGTTIRDTDVTANLSDYAIKDARLILTSSNQETIHCELYCFSQASDCCFIGELDLRKQWFKSTKP